jgi:hypothetical protein
MRNQHKWIKSILWNGALAAVVVLGFHYGYDLAQYVAIGVIWFVLAAYSGAVFLYQSPLPVLQETTGGFWVARVFDVALALILLSASAYLTATAYILSCFLYYHAAKKPPSHASAPVNPPP